MKYTAGQKNGIKIILTMKRKEPYEIHEHMSSKRAMYDLRPNMHAMLAQNNRK